MNIDTIILANGENPVHQIPLDILKNSSKIICCDGAISFLETLNIVPEIIIGDCDSITNSQFQNYKEKIIIDKNLEYNDLQKALRFCISNNIKEVVILGASGLRDDHFLANIGILMHYSKNISLKMITNFGIFIPINETTTFNSKIGQQISIFSFSPEVEISYSGLKYPVKNQTFKELWEGTLNESLGEKFTIELNKRGNILVYLEC